jgi:hypothetical protein
LITQKPKRDLNLILTILQYQIQEQVNKTGVAEVHEENASDGNKARWGGITKTAIAETHGTLVLAHG